MDTTQDQSKEASNISPEIIMVNAELYKLIKRKKTSAADQTTEGVTTRSMTDGNVGNPQTGDPNQAQPPARARRERYGILRPIHGTASAIPAVISTPPEDANNGGLNTANEDTGSEESLALAPAPVPTTGEQAQPLEASEETAGEEEPGEEGEFDEEGEEQPENPFVEGTQPAVQLQGQPYPIYYLGTQQLTLGDVVLIPRVQEYINSLLKQQFDYLQNCVVYQRLKHLGDFEMRALAANASVQLPTPPPPNFAEAAQSTTVLAEVLTSPLTKLQVMRHELEQQNQRMRRLQHEYSRLYFHRTQDQFNLYTGNNPAPPPPPEPHPHPQQPPAHPSFFHSSAALSGKNLVDIMRLAQQQAPANPQPNAPFSVTHFWDFVAQCQVEFQNNILSSS